MVDGYLGRGLAVEMSVSVLIQEVGRNGVAVGRFDFESETHACFEQHTGRNDPNSEFVYLPRGKRFPSIMGVIGLPGR